MNNLFIPEKIKVGFQEREDTYTGKLAYVVYYKKNKLMKEKSWKGWCTFPGDTKSGKWEKGKYVATETHGDDMKPLDFDNVPTEGFVLNKKVGGYKSDWNFRQTYCRVYDPRGFEFEINIPNLLFILQECNAYKGKGLEGEFVYAWDGADLALLPAHCKEYQDSIKHTKLQFQNIGVKDLEPGCYYKTKDQQNEYMYLGKFNYINQHYKGSGAIEKNHVFYNPKGGDSYWTPKFIGMTSLSTLAMKMNDVAVPEFAEKLEEFSKSKWSGSISELTTTVARLTFPKDGISDYTYRYDFFWGTDRYNTEVQRRKLDVVFLKESGNVYRVYTIYAHRQLKAGESYGYRQSDYNHWYTISSSKVICLENGELITRSRKFSDEKIYSENEIKEKGFIRVHYSLNGKSTSKPVLA